MRCAEVVVLALSEPKPISMLLTTAPCASTQLNTGEEEELTGAKKSRAAAIRCYIELGRLEMKAKQFDEAETQLKAGLDMATSVFGAETQQAGGWSVQQL